jgi:DNA processing protein
VAVLGCGIDVVYPPENGELFDRLARGAGAVVSEFAPATQPTPQNFPRRNRTISGLSDAVVVVRAALQSGALITTNHAKLQARPIYAVPGDTGNPLAAGPNELLRRNEAEAVTSALDILTKLRWPIPDELLEPPADEAKREVDPAFPSGKQEPVKPVTDHEVIDEESLHLWRLLDDRTPAHVDDLSLRGQIPVQVALRKLADLELKGMVVQRPGKYFLRK